MGPGAASTSYATLLHKQLPVSTDGLPTKFRTMDYPASSHLCQARISRKLAHWFTDVLAGLGLGVAVEPVMRWLTKPTPIHGSHRRLACASTNLSVTTPAGAQQAPLFSRGPQTQFRSLSRRGYFEFGLSQPAVQPSLERSDYRARDSSCDSILQEALCRRQQRSGDN